MMRRVCRSTLACVSATILAMAAPQPTDARLLIAVESGAAFNTRNDARIPGDRGTDFSLVEDLSVDPIAFFRAQVSYLAGERHAIGLLAAPLRFSASGEVERTIRFRDAEFAAGVPLRAQYRFDSYRAFWRYRILRRETFDADLGLTAKIRHAAVRLEGGGQSRERPDTGFVPLIGFRLRWQATRPVALLLEGDALAAPQGRAEDVMAALETRIHDRLAVRAGYRVLEGGVDIDEVYNFALVHYAAAALVVRL